MIKIIGAAAAAFCALLYFYRLWTADPMPRSRNSAVADALNRAAPLPPPRLVFAGTQRPSPAFLSRWKTLGTRRETA